MSLTLNWALTPFSWASPFTIPPIKIPGPISSCQNMGPEGPVLLPSLYMCELNKLLFFVRFPAMRTLLHQWKLYDSGCYALWIFARDSSQQESYRRTDKDWSSFFKNHCKINFYALILKPRDNGRNIGAWKDHGHRVPATWADCTSGLYSQRISYHSNLQKKKTLGNF